MSDPREAAALYISLGWYPIPLRKHDKACRDSDWRDRIYSAEEFDADGNIGIRLVNADDARTKKVVGVDLDCPEAVLSAEFLPESGASWGRESKAISQILYDSPFERPIVHKDTATGKTIVEIRVDHQSMAPPSTHPSGEVLSWIATDYLVATVVEAAVLARAVRLVATCAMVSRYYNNPGDRHEWCLALGGLLRQCGLAEEEARRVVANAAGQAGDKKVKDRVQEIASTWARLDSDPIAGATRLAELSGEEFVDTIRRIWGERNQFATDDKGKRINANSQENIRKALEKMEVRLSRDEFAGRLVVAQAGESRVLDDEVSDRMWLEIDSRFKFRPTRDFFDTVVRDTARLHPFHPVRDYLDGLKWDRKPRVRRWLAAHGGAQDNEYTQTVGELVLVAAVRRVRQPGCKFDELLVLESPQGQNKSSALRALCPSDDWFSDDLPLGVDSKEVIERTSGKWIVEAAELVNMRKAQAEQLKGFLSRQVDGPVRMAYARHPIQAPRQFVAIGTTNAGVYLKDSSGNRRFWPVRVKLFDVEAIRSERDQLWAEAAYIESAGGSLRMPQSMWRLAGEQQESRRAEDPWEGRIRRFCEERLEGTKQRVDPEVLWKLLGIPLERRDERMAERISAIMQSLGFRRIAVRVKDTGVTKGWGRDQDESGVWRPAGW